MGRICWPPINPWPRSWKRGADHLNQYTLDAGQFRLGATSGLGEQLSGQSDGTTTQLAAIYNPGWASLLATVGTALYRFEHHANAHACQLMLGTLARAAFLSLV